jgi:diguanylate cyclase (GGDEF)-like protein
MHFPEPFAAMNPPSNLSSAGVLPPSADVIPAEMLRLALTSADTVLYRWDLETGAMSFSENFAEVFPFPLASPQHESEWFALIDPADRLKWQEQRAIWLERPVASSNYRYRLHHEGRSWWIRQSAVALESGKTLIGVIYFRVSTPVEADSPEVVATAPLLPTTTERRPHFNDLVYPEDFVTMLQNAMNASNQQRTRGALLILSIANFGMIINAYGHRGSETVMSEVAVEIQKLLRQGDGLYRIHRDQFGIILADCTETEIEHRATRISDMIHNYGHRASVGSLHAICAMGSMIFPAAQYSASEIIDKAYIALHKTNGTIHRAYSEGPDDKMLARQQMGLANYLRKAILENRLRLAYQPIVSSRTGKVEHYEALLRMIGEDGTISSAGALIPIAERMGLIDMIDHLVLEKVVKELEQSPLVHIALNVSNLTTDNQQWLDHCKSLLQNRPELTNRLMVEITETAAHRDLRRTAYFVSSLQELGCTVALDDFGSGYTSFRQLKALSVDYIKIDGSFIRDLTDNPDNRFFVKTLLEFTRCFNLKSVAECVENSETAAMLKELGVDYMQGYHFGHPENYRSWLS